MSECSTPMLLQILNLSSLRLAPQCLHFDWLYIIASEAKLVGEFIASEAKLVGEFNGISMVFRTSALK